MENSCSPWSWSMVQREKEILYFTRNWDTLLLWYFEWEISPTVLDTWELGSQLMVLFRYSIVGGIISLEVGFERFNILTASSSCSLLHACSLKWWAFDFLPQPPCLCSILRGSYYSETVNSDKHFLLWVALFMEFYHSNRKATNPSRKINQQIEANNVPVFLY